MPPHDPALQALIEAVRGAVRDGRSVRIVGGGTKDHYGGPLRGRLLDTRALAGVSSYEPTELVVTARAGTLLSDLESLLAGQGQCLAFEPPRLGTQSTIGGVVAAGIAGPARAAAGSVRDHLLGATIVDGRGTVLSFGGQVIKNVAGYDIARLMAGSMGILGLIAEVSLKVMPRAASQASLCMECDEAEALRRLAVWGGRPLPLTASSWHRGRLWLRLAGAEPAVRAAQRELGGEPVDATAAAAHWTALRDQTAPCFADACRLLTEDAAALKAAADNAGLLGVRPAAPTRALWRISVPPAAAPLGLAGDTLIEWGGAQRWLWTDATAAEVRAVAQRVGGHAVLYRGLDKSAGAFAPLPAALARIHLQLKRSFDPHGVFNPGRLYPEL